jgi:hypothetical protein
MQLKIKEKEKMVSFELSLIQQKFRKLSDLDESRKTDVMKEDEKGLLDSYISLVNEKSELSLQLDSHNQRLQMMNIFRSMGSIP